MYDKEDVIEISRLMFDIDYQNRGLGKVVLDLIIKLIKEREAVNEVKICTVPDNKNAISLYEKFGFLRTGNIVDGEIEFIYKI